MDDLEQNRQTLAFLTAMANGDQASAMAVAREFGVELMCAALGQFAIGVLTAAGAKNGLTIHATLANAGRMLADAEARRSE